MLSVDRASYPRAIGDAPIAAGVDNFLEELIRVFSGMQHVQSVTLHLSEGSFPRAIGDA